MFKYLYFSLHLGFIQDQRGYKRLTRENRLTDELKKNSHCLHVTNGEQREFIPVYTDI